MPSTDLIKQLLYRRTSGCTRVFLGSVLLSKWQISETFQIRARVLVKNGSGCHVAIGGQRVSGFCPDVDVCVKMEGFIQTQMKDDKQMRLQRDICQIEFQKLRVLD